MITMPTTRSKALFEADLIRLFTILEEMIPVYRKLLSLLQAEKRFIVEREVDQLILCTEEKEGVLAQLSHLNERRIKASLGFDASDSALTLKKLIPLCPTPQGERLRSILARLEALTTSINELNQMNGILVERVLGQISGLLGLFRQMSSNKPIYRETGKINDMPSSGRTIGKG